MKKSLIKLLSSSVTALVWLIGFWVGMSVFVMVQALSQVTQQDELSEAERLHNQAEALRLQGKYAEATVLGEKALTIRQKLLGDNHLDVGVSFNTLGELYTSQGRYLEAESFYQKSLDIIREDLRKQNLPDDNFGVAVLLSNLGGLYLLQGKYDEAEQLLQKSLAIKKQRAEGEHPTPFDAILVKMTLAETINNLAELYQAQGKYAEAEPLYQQSLSIWKQSLGKNHSRVALSINNLAALYQAQGKYAEAERLLQDSLDIWKQNLGENHPNVAFSLNNLAYVYIEQEKYIKAETFLQKSLDIWKLLGDNHPNVALSLNNLALLYIKQGRYTEAEPLLQKSLAIRKEKLGENHPDVAGSFNNLGDLYIKQGRYTEAKQLYEKSLAILEESLGENHPKVATSLNNLGYVYDSQGKYIEAETFYEKSLALRQKLLGDKYPYLASSLENLAYNYQSQGRYKEAESLYQKSLDFWKEKLGENHPYVATTFKNLAGLYKSQGNTTDAIEFLSQGLAVEERNLSENLVAGDETQKQDYMSTISVGTNIAISLNLQSLPNNPEATHLALKTIFERKGRILDVLTNSLQILRQRTDDLETQDLLNQLITQRTQLSNLIFKKPEDFPSLETYRILLTNVEKEVKELEDKLSRRSAEFRNLSQPITLEKIQQQIPAKTALVELVRYRQFNPKALPKQRLGDSRYAAYILYQTGEPQAIDLGEAEPIDKAVEKLRKYLRTPKFPVKQLKRSARELDEMVMQPVRQLLGDNNTIILSPDAALNLIPFEALVDENNQYLVENYQITYLTSGRDLLRQNPDNNRQTPLVIANPNYKQQGEIVALDNYRSIDLSNRVFLPLKGTQQEAETISQLFPEALTLTKTKATENALKQVKNPKFLHLATHGFFLPKPTSENSTNFDNPLFRSGLVFAGVEKRQSGGDDGVLTAYEATLLNLVGTQLVVLSACDTGIGDITAMEGTHGLRRAFVIAGSESQMISLWAVEDEATKDLMVAYYQGLKGGKGRRDALLDIQRDWLKQGDYQHPYYWASFIFSGDGTPMKF